MIEKIKNIIGSTTFEYLLESFYTEVPTILEDEKRCRFKYNSRCLSDTIRTIKRLRQFTVWAEACEASGVSATNHHPTGKLR